LVVWSAFSELDWRSGRRIFVNPTSVAMSWR
jgi:hypothetical protein